MIKEEGISYLSTLLLLLLGGIIENGRGIM